MAERSKSETRVSVDKLSSSAIAVCSALLAMPRFSRRFPVTVPDSPSNALGSAYAPGLIDPWPLLLSIEMGLSGL